MSAALTPRYICIEEDDGLWTVWDLQDQTVATLDSQTLDHRPMERAEIACEILNRIDASSFESSD